MEKKTIRQVKQFEKKTGSYTASGDTKGDITYTMVVFSHLRWGFVYQRPQHIISRMAREYKVLFVEEPIPFDEAQEDDYHLEIIEENLHVLKPKVKDIPSIKNVLETVLKNNTLEVGWFYSASFSPLLADFSFDKVIYDCMDELSLFKGAPPQLIHQEKFLLSEADVVFTGGKSLFESKNQHHPNVHCFPSSVEREHFEKAMGDISIPDDMKGISQPVVGYFGVIDERIDLDLLRETALLCPDFAFVMIGPIAKIAEEDLPREKNIHYLGMKSYASLPNYLKAFDIAMMPFALNDATKFISPTKTLEYMAAGKPIISTAIKDVERDYSHCISIIGTATEFANKLQSIWHVHQQDNAPEYQKILDKTSWDATADQMVQLIKTTVQ